MRSKKETNKDIDKMVKRIADAMLPRDSGGVRRGVTMEALIQCIAGFILAMKHERGEEILDSGAEIFAKVRLAVDLILGFDHLDLFPVSLSSSNK